MPSIRWEVPGAILAVGIAVGAAVAGAKSFELDRARETNKAYIWERVYDSLQPVNVTNCGLTRFGDANDGGYLVCANLLSGAQSAYSYGISGTDGWGCDVSRKLGLAVHEYDCFDLTQPECPGGRLIFHPECIGPTRTIEDGRPFDSLTGQYARNGDTGKRLLVKMDVEGAEWGTFLATPDAALETFEQLIIELHRPDELNYLRTIERLKKLFVIAHVHYNNNTCDDRMKPLPGWAVEVLFVNRRLAQTDGQPGAPGPIPGLDAPNNVKLPDCQAAAP